jgi:hypothetical protein
MQIARATLLQEISGLLDVADIEPAKAARSR